jgi:hypothetical protein
MIRQRTILGAGKVVRVGAKYWLEDWLEFS